MKITLGPMPHGKPLDAEWKPMREPRMWVVQWFAVALGLVLGALVAGVWLWAVPLRLMTVTPIGWLIAAVLLVVPAHELAHVAAQPGWGRRSVIGLWPEQLVFYAHYDGALSRTRMLWALALPWLVLTVAPLAAALVTRRASTLGFFIASANALICGGDGFFFGFILRAVPGGAKIQNSGWRSYWQ